MRLTVPEMVNGVVLLDKVPGETSFQSLFPVKRIYGRAVGHTGTLDKFAEGLLVVLVGKFTKFNPLFTSFDKVYEADFCFGAETSTLDPEGEVVFTGRPPDSTVPGLVSQWVGEQWQIPPEYSAIHVQGKRASDRVRDGQKIELPARLVTVYSLEVLRWQNPTLTVRIHCSKGTYVRSIARDWGRACGSGAHVTRLLRVRVGPFERPKSGSMEFLDSQAVLDQLGIPSVLVPEQAEGAILNGRQPENFVPHLGGLASSTAGLVKEGGGLLALVEREEDRWKYVFVDRGLAE